MEKERGDGGIEGEEEEEEEVGEQIRYGVDRKMEKGKREKGMLLFHW